MDLTELALVLRVLNGNDFRKWELDRAKWLIQREINLRTMDPTKTKENDSYGKKL